MKMYYEKKKKSYGTVLIIFFLIIIIVILVNFMKKIENVLWKEEKVELAGTDTVLNEFNLQDLAKNSSYSIVRSF